MKRIMTAGALALAMLAGLPLGASAAPIVGGFEKTGIFVPVDGGLNNLATATALDFLNLLDAPGTTSPGAPGEFLVNTASGDFAAIAGFVGSVGSIEDFTFSGPAQVGFPVAPLLLEFGLPGGVTFTLNTVGVDFQDESFLNLSGSGVFTATGFDDTAGIFVFSGQTAGAGTFSFSASQDTEPVPEPASMALFAIGLFGAGIAARRRQRVR
jgi:hypothetical protein